MSLDQVVSRLLAKDPRSPSPFYEAICLYEFQVAILYPEAFERLLNASELSDRAPCKLLRQARIYAAIRILEHLEKAAAGDGKSIGLRDVAQSPDYARLYDEIVLTNGGWKQIRYMRSIRSFEKSLLKRRRRAKTAGKCIDFSFRFDTIPNPGKTDGGSTLACEVVTKAEHYQSEVALTKVKERWNEFKVSSAFAYLHLVERLLRRRKLTRSSFAENLLKTAADKEQLRKFFRSYQQLCQALQPRNYVFPKLVLPLGDEKFLTAKPFDGTDVPSTLAEIRKTVGK